MLPRPGKITLTAEPADSVPDELEVVRVGTTIVPVTSVKPVLMRTAPAQLELYSTWLVLVSKPDLIIG